MQLFFILLVIFNILLMLALFVRKSGLQLQYLRLKDKKEAGKISDFLLFDYQNAAERQLRLKAFLLFPMLYPVVLDEDREELNQLKGKVKRTHVGIYLGLILFIILGVYSEKVFPA